MNLKRNKKGFTLVELIVVLVIIGILLAMVIPNLTGYIDKARLKNTEAEARNVYMAAMALAAEEYNKPTPATKLSKDQLEVLAKTGGTYGDVSISNGGVSAEFEYTNHNITVKVSTAGVITKKE